VLPGQNRWLSIQRIIARHVGECGIIYCGSRDATEKIAAKLRDIGVKADHYHAGRTAEERSAVQDDFISGKLHVICATIAFGMGIDKADVRFVVHYNMPGNVESYYQEIGRAGRDGKPSETILFYSYADVQSQMYHIDKVEDPRYKQILIAKLERMKEYAEAQVCRRTILLSYFSEITGAPCGNCDVCKDPPKYFDGTVLAQKALSAVVRCKEQVSMSVLIDVLKGTYSPEVQEKHWHTVKTFGAGGDTSAFAWMLFLQQLIQHGLLEVDYRDHHHLKITEAGRAVVQGERSVRLVSPETIKERQERPKKKEVAPVEPTDGVTGDLLSRLKALRRIIAQEIGKPAYIVFSDATLIDMAEKRPMNVYEFRLVNGVGDHKAKLYAERFLATIAQEQ
jgi:ATP-dependent DNA helicase RecQ